MMYNIPSRDKPVNEGHERLLRKVHLIHIETGFIKRLNFYSRLRALKGKVPFSPDLFCSSKPVDNHLNPVTTYVPIFVQKKKNWNNGNSLDIHIIFMSANSHVLYHVMSNCEHS